MILPLGWCLPGDPATIEARRRRIMAAACTQPQQPAYHVMKVVLSLLCYAMQVLSYSFVTSAPSHVNVLHCWTNPQFVLFGLNAGFVGKQANPILDMLSRVGSLSCSGSKPTSTHDVYAYLHQLCRTSELQPVLPGQQVPLQRLVLQYPLDQAKAV